MIRKEKSPSSPSASTRSRSSNHNKRTYRHQRGLPTPLGATVRKGGTNFAIFSCHANAVTLILFAGDRGEDTAIPLDPHRNKTGDIWHIFVDDVDNGTEYGFNVDGPPDDLGLHRFEPQQLLLDPYAVSVSGRPEWGKELRDGIPPAAGAPNIRRSVVVDEPFDWGMEQPLNLPLTDTIIYEMHVRGFTRHPSSGVQHPGTFGGIMEKIPYLQELGVTAIELLPIHEFEEVEQWNGGPRINYWGYNPLNFFAVKTSYASSGAAGKHLHEFRELVKACHQAGLEVILDVVLNHTGEGNEEGPVISLKGLDNSIYYMLDPVTGEYRNYSGCGNTLNCNHPVVRDMILSCLRYWVTEMHIDGFRFDLASILGRGVDGQVLANPPLLERIAYDPVLAKTKLIAEAWDAGGLYQVGTFPAWGRWAEWNGRFRDDVRCFVKGDDGMVPQLAQRLVGSPEIYRPSGRAPCHSINFITSHDGFTLRDLVSYNDKHNEANGENNRDGHNENHSWNCGVEGESDSHEINRLRVRQTKNHLALLLLSHGVPMLLAGDEFGRTQGGNNNAYCQDNDVSWLNWELLQTNYAMFRFVKLLIAWRKKHPNLRPALYKTRDDQALPQTTWHGVKLNQPDWSETSHAIALQLHNNSADDDLYLIANAYWEALTFEIPQTQTGRWRRAIDTSLDTPDDIHPPERPVALEQSQRYKAAARSVVLLVAR